MHALQHEVASLIVLEKRLDESLESHGLTVGAASRDE